MMKRIFLPISLIILVGFLGLVIASEIESGVPIYKGWNLIYGFTPNSLDGQAFEFSHIKAIYSYVPQEGRYVRLFPRPENSIVDKYGDSYFEKQVNWVYSDVSDTSSRTEYWLEEPLPIGETTLVSGWNFVRVTPDMFYEKDGTEVFSWNSIKGSCIIQRVYAWNPETQDWMQISPSEESFDFDDFLMMGMAVRVSNNCKLEFLIISPPSLPIIEEESTDEDTEEESTDDNTIESTYFPKTISTYSLYDSGEEPEECIDDGSLCAEGLRGEYRDSATNSVVFVGLWDIDVTDATKGSEEAQLKEYFASSFDEDSDGTLDSILIGSNKLYRLEDHELFWFTGKDFPPLIFTQEGSLHLREEGSYDFTYGTATGDNAVTKKFLSLYPSKEVEDATQFVSACVTNAPFNCKDYTIGTNAINLNIGNGGGEFFVIDQVKITINEKICSTSSAWTLGPNTSHSFILSCNNALTLGANIDGDIAIMYHKSGSNIKLVSTGAIKGQVY